MYLYLTLNLILNVQKDHCTLFKQHLLNTWPVAKTFLVGLSVGLAGTIGWLGTCGFWHLAEPHLVVFEKAWHKVHEITNWNYGRNFLQFLDYKLLYLLYLLRHHVSWVLCFKMTDVRIFESSQALKSSHTFSELGSWNAKNRALEISAMERGDLESINTDPRPPASKKVAEVCGWLWW